MGEGRPTKRREGTGSWEGSQSSIGTKEDPVDHLKLSDVTFDESLIKGGRSVKTPAHIAGKLLGEVTTEDLVGVILHAPAVALLPKTMQDSMLSGMVTPMMVGEED